MSSFRIKRVEEALRAEIGEIIRREMSETITAFMSITAVEISKDLSSAKVFVSFLNKWEAEKTLEKLEKAGGFIRSELNKVIRLKKIPRLIFRQDETIENAFKLEKLFDKIKEDERRSKENSPDD